MTSARSRRGSSTRGQIGRPVLNYTINLKFGWQSPVLTYAEVSARNASGDVKIFYEAYKTGKYRSFDGNQCVLYDDVQSFNDKKELLSKLCLGGLMVWALDQDNSRLAPTVALPATCRCCRCRAAA